MTRIWYERVVNTCLIVAAVSIVEASRTGGVYEIIFNAVAILASVVSVATYFYNQHLLRKQEDDKAR